MALTASDKKEIEVSDLNLDEILLLQDGHCFRDGILNLCKNQGVAPANNFQIQSGSFETLIKLADEGLGLTLLPYLHTLDLKENDKLKLKHFKDPKPTDRKIKAKFFESDDTEVSEQIMCFSTGDNPANLVILMERIVGLGDLYDMWEEGNSRKLSQSMHRALTGQVKKDWSKVIIDVDWNDIDKLGFIQLLQKLATKTFGTKAYKKQIQIMEEGKIKIPANSSLRSGAQRFFQMNTMLPYLGEYARELTIEELNKVITKSLPPKAYGKYCGDGGDDMDDEDEILDLLSSIDTKLDLKAEVAFLKRKENNAKNINNSNGKSSDKNKGKQNNGGENGKSKDDKPKPCYKHDGEHDYRDCPDNKNRRPQPQSESKKEKEKNQKKRPRRRPLKRLRKRELRREIRSRSTIKVLR